MRSIPISEQEWLSHFFSGTNALKWEQILAGTAPAGWLSPLTPWLEQLSVTPDRPLLLPKYSPDGTRQWYAMALNEQIAGQLREEMQAFIGPSFGRAVGQWHELSDTDESERALRSRFDWRVLRIEFNHESDRPHAERAIARYAEVLRRRPQIPDRTSRPFGLIRRDFDLAILAGNAERAKQLLDELVNTGRIAADQQRFLKIRRLAGLGRIEEVARDRVLIDSIMNLSLPPQTLTDVVESLYEVYIEPSETLLPFADLVTQFQKYIARPFGSLFRERKGIRRPKLLRAFFLFEATQVPQNRQRCEALLATYPKDDSGVELVRHWLRALQPVARTETADEVRQAIADEDYETAARLATQGLPERWAYSALLRCATESDSDDLRKRLIERLKAMDATVLATLTERDRARWQRMNGETSAPARSLVQDGWLEWAQQVCQDRSDWAPLEVLSNAVLKWDISSYSAHPERCVALAELIGNAREPAAQVFRSAFPALVEFFVEREERPNRAFVPVYSMLIRILAWSGSLSADELEIATALARALLGTGPDDKLYSESLEDLREIIATNTAAVHIDWSLGLAELLGQYPAQNSELRLRVFYAVFEVCRTAAHRLTPEQRAVLELLASDYQTPELLAALPPANREEASPQTTRFTGLIGIYTLNEPAGQRARMVLGQLLPSARVELNHATAANDRLRQLAKNADLFVFAWKTSTHQAFYCVKDARAEGDIVLPPGGGTASLVRSVMDTIRNCPATTSR